MISIRICHLSVAFFCLLLGAACSPPPKDSSVPAVTVAIPDTLPSIVGQITAMALPMIVVEENPAESQGSAKASVRIVESTRVLRPDKGAVSAADLQVGQKVRVWFVGPVMESYPVQAAAGTIVIGHQ